MNEHEHRYDRYLDNTKGVVINICVLCGAVDVLGIAMFNISCPNCGVQWFTEIEPGGTVKCPSGHEWPVLPRRVPA